MECWLFSLLALQVVEGLQKRCVKSRKRGSISYSASPARCGHGEAKRLLHLYFSTMLRKLCEGFGAFYPLSHSFLIALLQLSVIWPVLPQAAQDGAVDLGEAAHI